METSVQIIVKVLFRKRFASCFQLQCYQVSIGCYSCVIAIWRFIKQIVTNDQMTYIDQRPDDIHQTPTR